MYTVSQQMLVFSFYRNYNEYMCAYGYNRQISGGFYEVITDHPGSLTVEYQEKYLQVL